MSGRWEEEGLYVRCMSGRWGSLAISDNESALLERSFGKAPEPRTLVPGLVSILASR
jgi:hypothetical protein